MSAARSIVGILLLFLLSFSSFPVAQSRSDARLRFLSAKQGEAIVQAAWELRRGLNPKPDCSHFVHAVYAKAGFAYEYAATREVFAGIDDFRRVQKPQPGDLIVWPGHIGIVIDPGEHSFYSSVLSGFAIENYRSHYWEARGDPRFYRFVVNPSASLPRPVLTKITQVHPAPEQPPLQQTQRSPASSHKPAEMATVADSPKSASRQPAQIEVKPSVQAKVEGGAGNTAERDTAIHNEIFVTSQATPSRRDVLAAIIRSADENGERLLRDRLLDSQPAVGVADDFRLVSLNLDLQGKTGLAEVEVKQIAAFRYGKPTSSRSISRHRVILSRQQQGWILVTPQELLYLNHHQAAVALTDQLATLSQAPADQLQAKKTAKILHELLSDKSTDAHTGSSD
jgi:hypothetical protein